MTNLKSENAYRFWRRVDELRGGRELLEIASSSGIKYKSMLVQRSNTTYPKAHDLVALARCLNTTVEMLVAGEPERGDELMRKFLRNNRLLAIATKLSTASERILVAVEVVLGLDPKGDSEKHLSAPDLIVSEENTSKEGRGLA